MLLIKQALSHIVTNGTTSEQQQLLQELSIKISCTELMWNHLQSFVFLRLQIQQLPACQENSTEHNQHLNLHKLQLPISTGNNFRQNACVC